MSNPQDSIEAGMSAAVWITTSPHEWKWSQGEQEAMARCCMAQAEKLRVAVEALERIANRWDDRKIPNLQVNGMADEAREALSAIRSPRPS